MTDEEFARFEKVLGSIESVLNAETFEGRMLLR